MNIKTLYSQTDVIRTNRGTKVYNLTYQTTQMTPQNKEKLELLVSWSGFFVWFGFEMRQLISSGSKHQGTDRWQSLAPESTRTKLWSSYWIWGEAENICCHLVANERRTAQLWICTQLPWCESLVILTHPNMTNSSSAYLAAEPKADLCQVNKEALKQRRSDAWALTFCYIKKLTRGEITSHRIGCHPCRLLLAPFWGTRQHEGRQKIKSMK